MSMLHLAEEMKRYLASRKGEIHAEMEKGKTHDEYMRLVGRIKELDRTLDWVNETATKLFGSEDELDD